ncbi:holo-[acyl-carrier-protein] synthase [Cohnella pontilimi]|uniref:Holo-[acyl-carrier-protein] synthase n=1 Tax=Cohnella pontilimi TaxID=2564100 RepID=A0A4U0FGD1_9BACL|nr:holo-ACP synthase [Cohnella pontilimi]TJY42432.1 holo-[acyl-carrier-protein] synthase [Cohnella pontilimi]
MIIGIGLDMVELERVARIVEQPTGGARFADRVLTEREKARWAALPSRRALEFLAGRFAAKEAVVKALGCGIGAAVGFRDIEILPDAAGKPACVVTDAAWSRLGAAGANHKILVAITHERTMAAATAVVERIE